MSEKELKEALKRVSPRTRETLRKYKPKIYWKYFKPKLIIVEDLDE